MMKDKLFGLLAMTAAMDMMPYQPTRMKRRTAPENGNSRRTHKENVRRKKLRRLINKAKQVNR